jgi:flagellar hook-associated protein 2
MATSSIVKTLGAGSGIDVKALAQSLVDAEKTPQKERIEAQIAKSEARITGYGAVKYALSTLKTAFAKLDDASDFSSIKPSNTQPSAFGVTASSSAEAGSYSIEVLQTALAQRTASSHFAARDTTLNGGVAFQLNLTIGDEIKDPIDVTTTTPAGMVGAINGAKLGVTAQLINTGSGHQIVLTGETGETKAFAMSTSATNPTVPTASTITFAQSLQSAADASFRVNGLTVTRSSNTVNDVIDGVTLELFTKTATDANNNPVAARLDLNRDTASIKSNIQGLVTAYNDFEQTLKILGDRASEVEDFGGVLAGESLLQSVRNQVRGLITNTSSTPGTSIKAARDVGLTIDRLGQLTLDESKLDKALQNNFGEVSTMFSAGTNNKSIYSAAPAGLAGGAIKSIEKMLLSTSMIDTQSKSASAKITKYKDELTQLDERMEQLMNRYMTQFTVMESIVGSSNNTRESLKGTFAGMMAAYNR